MKVDAIRTLLDLDAEILREQPEIAHLEASLHLFFELGDGVAAGTSDYC
jgi:hypothetical protein